MGKAPRKNIPGETTKKAAAAKARAALAALKSKPVSPKIPPTRLQLLKRSARRLLRKVSATFSSARARILEVLRRGHQKSADLKDSFRDSFASFTSFLRWARFYLISFCMVTLMQCRCKIEWAFVVVHGFCCHDVQGKTRIASQNADPLHFEGNEEEEFSKSHLLAKLSSVRISGDADEIEEACKFAEAAGVVSFELDMAWAEVRRQRARMQHMDISAALIERSNELETLHRGLIEAGLHMEKDDARQDAEVLRRARLHAAKKLVKAERSCNAERIKRCIKCAVAVGLSDWEIDAARSCGRGEGVLEETCTMEKQLETRAQAMSSEEDIKVALKECPKKRGLRRPLPTLIGEITPAREPSKHLHVQKQRLQAKQREFQQQNVEEQERNEQQESQRQVPLHEDQQCQLHQSEQNENHFFHEYGCEHEQKCLDEGEHKRHLQQQQPSHHQEMMLQQQRFYEGQMSDQLSCGAELPWITTVNEWGNSGTLAYPEEALDAHSGESPYVPLCGAGQQPAMKFVVVPPGSALPAGAIPVAFARTEECVKAHIERARANLSMSFTVPVNMFNSCVGTQPPWGVVYH